MCSKQWMLMCRTSLWQAQESSILMLSGGGKGQSKYLSGIQLFFCFILEYKVWLEFTSKIWSTENGYQPGCIVLCSMKVGAAWKLAGSRTKPPSSVSPPFPSGPPAQMSPQPAQTDGQEVLRLKQGLSWLRFQHICGRRTKASKHMHAAYLPPFPMCTPTCVVCTCEFLDLKGELAFMHVSYEEMALRCAQDGSSNGVSSLWWSLCLGQCVLSPPQSIWELHLHTCSGSPHKVFQ